MEYPVYLVCERTGKPVRVGVSHAGIEDVSRRVFVELYGKTCFLLYPSKNRAMEHIWGNLQPDSSIVAPISQPELQSLLFANQDVQAILWDSVPGETVKLIPVSAFLLGQVNAADA